MLTNSCRCHFINWIVMMMSDWLIIYARWQNNRNHRRVKKIDMNGYFSDFFSWYDVSTWYASCVKSLAPDNAVTICKLNIHEMLTTCHSVVNRDQIQVIWGRCMFLRSRSSFLTSVFKFDEVLIKYSYIMRHVMIQSTNGWWKSSASSSNKVRLTPTRNIGCMNVYLTMSN